MGVPGETWPLMIAEWYTPLQHVWEAIGFEEELASRGFNVHDIDETMPYYRFATDGKKVHALIKEYTYKSMYTIFATDADVVKDEKLQYFFS